LVLGHDIRAMQNPNWKLLLLRGTEWAATGRATMEVPFDISGLLQAAAGYRRSESREHLAAIEQLVHASARNPGLRKILAQQLAEMLESNATMDFKKFACSQLSLVGTPAEVPRLARLLGDPELGFAARAALERIPGEESLKALRGAAQGLSGLPLVGVINSLGERRDARAIDLLAGYLKPGNDPEIMSAAVQAFGKIGGSESAEVLFTHQPGMPAELLPLFVESLLKCAQGFESAGQSSQAAAIYRQLSASTLPPNLRTDVFSGTLRCAGKRSEDLLIEALRNGDELLQAAAISFLRTSQGKKFASAAASRVASLPDYLIAQFIYALADLRHNEALPEIYLLLLSPNPQVRLAALSGLELLGDASSVERLIGLIEGASDSELSAIRKALAHLPGQDIDARLIAEIDGKYPLSVRREMIIALSNRDCRRAVPALLQAADAEESEVRREAIKALAALADASIAPALVGMMSDEKSSAERPFLESALISIGRRAKTLDSVIDVVLTELPGSAAEAKEPLLRILGSFGGERAFRAVLGQAEDANPETRNSAIRALSAWPDATPLQDLLTIAGASSDIVPKTLALRGVANLVAKAVGMPGEERAAILDQALGLGDSAETKKLLLSALGMVPSRKALSLAVSYLDQPEIAVEAAIAAASASKNLFEVGQRSSADKISVAVITGGHEFEQAPFLRLFEDDAGIEFLFLPQADDSEIFEDISRWPCDVIVLYNMTQNISSKRRENFLRLLHEGVGVLALHHASGSFQDWPEYQKIIGCRYFLAPGETEGKKHEASSFVHDVNIAVQVSDSMHPVSRGLKDFMVHDETYKGCLFEPGSRILLTTDEPTSDKTLCLVRNYGRANVCYLQLGHGASAYADPNFRKLVSQAIRWCAEPRLSERKAQARTMITEK
ncbi:MAG: HEAT repeat domain-containing protein, partial [Acidobacteriota bacterium]